MAPSPQAAAQLKRNDLQQILGQTLSMPYIFKRSTCTLRIDLQKNIVCLLFVHKFTTSFRVANKPVLNGW